MWGAELHRTAEEGFEAAVKAQSNNGNMVLHLAVRRGQEAVARLLLERGANATTQNQNGTALHGMAADGYKEVFQIAIGRRR